LKSAHGEVLWFGVVVKIWLWWGISRSLEIRVPSRVRDASARGCSLTKIIGNFM
jgi:hypothetical protein